MWNSRKRIKHCKRLCMPVNMGEIEILIPVELFQCVLNACILLEIVLFRLINLHPLWMISLVSQAMPFAECKRKSLVTLWLTSCQARGSHLHVPCRSVCDWD